MRGEERRNYILSLLKDAKEPVKGGELSNRLKVSRQVIVQDIALLRAEGADIISTPQGYLLLQNAKNTVRRIIAVKHEEKDIEDELKTIVCMGGKVLDVTIEHKIYGEITGRLMLKSMYDVDEFMEKLKSNKSKPLSYLTDGVHIHTIEADNEEIMDRIIDVLKLKGYIIPSEV
ncbi:transcription repressor NadR [Caloramator sp. E03]|uniref:transcription repressor NadR n=1 Tax=Caloramator sp. E03 TaxID=2576307 RepID=UPI0011103AEB|nr:transcription repressor NadR [Caloramator sp. E03]QCX33573.1 transcription repressor NadR [Caloramator sp. E03]